MFNRCRDYYKEDDRIGKILDRGKFLLSLKEDEEVEFKSSVGFVSFFNCNSFLSALHPIFGFFSSVFSIQDGYSEEYDCSVSEYYSNELAVTVDNETGFVLRVSYYGDNSRAVNKIKSFVKSYKNYSFLDTGTGFLIERD